MEVPKKESDTKHINQESNSKKFSKKINVFKNIYWFFVSLPLLLVIIFVIYSLFSDPVPGPGPKASLKPPDKSKFNLSMKKFTSLEEMKAYLEEASAAEDLGFYSIITPRSMETFDINSSQSDINVEAPIMGIPEAGGGRAERVSETNVQVVGIDEPDIVKTDGKEIYYSQAGYYQYFSTPTIDRSDGVVMNQEEKDTRVPSKPEYLTRIIRGFPPEDLKEYSSIDKTGDLLLVDNMLLVFPSGSYYGSNSSQTINGFDVSDPTNAKEEWDIELDSRVTIVDARLYKDKIYLVTQQRINRNKPCPIKPMLVNGREIVMECNDIYYPGVNAPADVTFNVMKINPQNGEIEEKSSFIGSSGMSIVYMSPNAIYTTYTYYNSIFDFLYGFFAENAGDLIPESIVEDMKRVKEYDLSDAAKMTEFENIIVEWMDGLSEDEMLRVENELTDKMENYAQEKGRDLESTGIAKINLQNLEVDSTGVVPGHPLNQFALDEYKDNLRIAVTINNDLGGESANDVYVLDSSLNEVGSVKNLGLDESIYSVRFIKDQGYLVTFKQIDPFYVLDLSDPTNPQMTGELKIPGYSSYLHPLTEEMILGIGKEEGKVKLAVFDVSDPSDPKEKDKYMLDEYWSDILDTHHAFLLDSKHEIFFLPGNKGGYVFSYDEGNLSLEKAVKDVQAARAIYLEDYLYILGREITVLNENDWTEVNSLSF